MDAEKASTTPSCHQLLDQVGQPRVVRYDVGQRLRDRAHRQAVQAKPDCPADQQASL
jgi:hypothetical protein